MNYSSGTRAAMLKLWREAGVEEVGLDWAPAKTLREVHAGGATAHAPSGQLGCCISINAITKRG